MASGVALRPDWTQSSQTPLMIETQLLSPSPSALQQEHHQPNESTPNFLNPFTTAASTLSPTAHTMPPPALSPSSLQVTIDRTVRHSPLPPLPMEDGEEDAVIMEAKEVFVQHCRPSKPRLISIEQDSEKSPTRTEMTHACLLRRQQSDESINDPQPRLLKRSITENEALHARSAAANKARRPEARRMSNDDKDPTLPCRPTLLQIPGPRFCSSRPITAVADMRHIQDEMPLEELRGSLAHKQSCSAHSCHGQPSPLSHQWSPNSPASSPASSPDVDVAAPEHDASSSSLSSSQFPASDGGDLLSKPPSRRPKPPKPPRLQISTDFHSYTIPQQQQQQQQQQKMTPTPAEKFYKHPIKSASRALFSSNKTAEEPTSTPPPPPTSNPGHPMTPLSPRNIKSLFGLSRKKSHSIKNGYPSPVDSQMQTQMHMRADSPDVILESPTATTTSSANGIPSPPLSAGLVRKHSIAMSISSKKSSSRLSSAFNFSSRKKTASK